jgi:hypothetical protein
VRAGVPEGFAVLGVFKGVQIFFGHSFFLLLMLGKGIKNTHPLITSGVGYKVFHGSTLVVPQCETTH